MAAENLPYTAAQSAFRTALTKQNQTNKLTPLIMTAIVAFSGAQTWAQNSRISTVAITTGVVAVTERTAANANAPVTTTNQPVYVGDNLAGLTFFNGNPGIDGTPTNASAGSASCRSKHRLCDGRHHGTPTVGGNFIVTVQSTNAAGTTSSTVTITIAGGPSSRIVNFSARALSGPDAQTLIMGFVVSGNNKNLLVRGIGPSLTPHGVVNVLVDPMLTLFSTTGAIAINDDWPTTAVGQMDGAGTAAELTSAAAQAGAFALVPGSQDAALLVTLPPGGYTVQVTGVNSTTGVALLEIYDMQ